MDVPTGKRQMVVEVPGFARGLAFAGRHAFIGLSKIRTTSAMDGVPLAERRDELFAALARLKEEERTAIVARYFIGLTDEETAAALGVRRGAVKMRVFRALEHLRAELGVTVDA